MEKPRQSYFGNAETPILIGTAEQYTHVKELEKELSQASSVPANSIRRETDLEEEVERLDMELLNSSSTWTNVGGRKPTLLLLNGNGISAGETDTIRLIDSAEDGKRVEGVHRRRRRVVSRQRKPSLRPTGAWFMPRDLMEGSLPTATRSPCLILARV